MLKTIISGEMDKKEKVEAELLYLLFSKLNNSGVNYEDVYDRHLKIAQVIKSLVYKPEKRVWVLTSFDTRSFKIESDGCHYTMTGIHEGQLITDDKTFKKVLEKALTDSFRWTTVKIES